MLGADVVVVEALGFFLGEGQDFSGPLSELVEPLVHPLPPFHGRGWNRASPLQAILLP